MPEFNLCHIDQITRDVIGQEIGFSHLFHDLVDHICCDVEQYMQQGMSFDEAYRMVNSKIGFRGLKMIQEETLYAVDNKYRKMKNLMKISGVSGTVMLGFAAIFKIAHLPLAGILLFLGAIVLSFLFLPSALTVLWKETRNGRKLVLFISAFIAGVSFILGMLFKIQHWPYSGIIISIGMITGAVLFVPALVIYLFQDQNKKNKRIVYIAGAVSLMIYCVGFWFRILHWPLAWVFVLSGTLLLLIVVLPWFTRVQWKEDSHINARFIFMTVAPLLFIMPATLVNLNLERTYDEGFYTRLEKQDALLNLQKKNNYILLANCHDSTGFSKMEVIHTVTVRLLSTIDQIEQNLVTIAEGTGSGPDQALSETAGANNGNPLYYRGLNISSNTLPASAMLLPGCKARAQLEKQMADYKEVLNKQFGLSWTDKNQLLLDEARYLPRNKASAGDLTLFPNLNSLSLLKSGILVTEAAAIKQSVSEVNKN